jgi:phenylalanyl-tRNA synthetase beta chain
VLGELVGRAPEVVTCSAENRPRHLHPRAAGVLLVGDVAVGTFGLLHPDVTDAFDLPEAVPVVTIDLRAASGLGVAPKYKAIPRFPASPRDLAVVVSDDVPAGRVLEAIASSAGALAAEVTLFDRFVGANIPKDHASLAFRVVYRSDERTLTDIEVEKTHARVVAEIGERFGAKLRT